MAQLKLEYYSVPKDDSHQIQHLYYINRMMPVEVPDELLDLLSWYAARDVCLVLGEKQRAEACTQRIMEIENSQTY